MEVVVHRASGLRTLAFRLRGRRGSRWSGITASGSSRHARRRPTQNTTKRRTWCIVVVHGRGRSCRRVALVVSTVVVVLGLHGRGTRVGEDLGVGRERGTWSSGTGSGTDGNRKRGTRGFTTGMEIGTEEVVQRQHGESRRGTNTEAATRASGTHRSTAAHAQLGHREKDMTPGLTGTCIGRARAAVGANDHLQGHARSQERSRASARTGGGEARPGAGRRGGARPGRMGELAGTGRRGSWRAGGAAPGLSEGKRTRPEVDDEGEQGEGRSRGGGRPAWCVGLVQERRAGG